MGLEIVYKELITILKNNVNITFSGYKGLDNFYMQISITFGETIELSSENSPCLEGDSVALKIKIER